MSAKSKTATWRKWNNVLHRDLGYLCAGLTVVYVVSGIAVNHVADWNPNYAIERRSVTISPVAGDPLTPNVAVGILEAAGVEGELRGSFRPNPDTLRIFIEGGTVNVPLAGGTAEVEMVRERAVLHAANFLHLNHPKKLWTWVADIYALALGVLAVTGLFVLKGKKGITGRGAWLSALGVVVPFVFLWLYL
ncbi:MAG: hypothetical protein HKM89_01770 [Gemmatimonadales bacterium]|nr:hypothetical protein [Gemmatimonadales bacterium]